MSCDCSCIHQCELHPWLFFYTSIITKLVIISKIQKDSIGHWFAKYYSVIMLSSAKVVREKPTPRPVWNLPDKTYRNNLCGAKATHNIEYKSEPVDSYVNIYAGLLQGCTKIKALKEVHAHTIVIGLKQNSLIQSKLVSMYTVCHDLKDTRECIRMLKVCFLMRPSDCIMKCDGLTYSQTASHFLLY